ncbi:hypothetical protein K474DRAFT_938849 [Panus rudis PR-1116 ss-1]|nr:hypothetical protein K474DRAFT_938849 [Panus rudis PR-1116 ss-1]
MSTFRLDLIMSKYSVFPFDTETTNSWLRCVVEGMKPCDNGLQICVIARSFESIYSHKFLDYHGQPEARMNRDESITQPMIHHSRPFWFNMLSPFFFWMPHSRMSELEEAWVDHTLNLYRWNEFIRPLKKEWES